MSTKPKTVDELIATILPEACMPSHVRLSDLLDDALIPPDGVAEKVIALRALVRRAGRDEPLTGKMASSLHVAQHFAPLLARVPTESVWIAGADSGNRITFTQKIGQGSISECPVHPTDVFRPILLNAASGAFLVHNHPSGVPVPSEADITLTHRVHVGALLLGIRLLDHIIVGADKYFSFLDAGLLTEDR